MRGDIGGLITALWIGIKALAVAWWVLPSLQGLDFKEPLKLM